MLCCVCFLSLWLYIFWWCILQFIIFRILDRLVTLSEVLVDRIMFFFVFQFLFLFMFMIIVFCVSSPIVSTTDGKEDLLPLIWQPLTHSTHTKTTNTCEAGSRCFLLGRLANCFHIKLVCPNTQKLGHMKQKHNIWAHNTYSNSY